MSGLDIDQSLESGRRSEIGGRLHRAARCRWPRIVADGFHFTNEIRLDAREEWLYVAETTGKGSAACEYCRMGARRPRDTAHRSRPRVGGWHRLRCIRQPLGDDDLCRPPRRGHAGGTSWSSCMTASRSRGPLRGGFRFKRARSRLTPCLPAAARPAICSPASRFRGSETFVQKLLPGVLAEAPLDPGISPVQWPGCRWCTGRSRHKGEATSLDAHL